MHNTDKFGFIMTETTHLLRLAFERRMASAGVAITPAEARTLAHVAQAKGGRQREIASRMGIEPMTLCGHIDGLVQCGLVKRVADPLDRRAKNIHITDKANEALAQVNLEIAGLCEAALAGIEEAERARFIGTLKTVRQNVRVLLAVGEEGEIKEADLP